MRCEAPGCEKDVTGYRMCVPHRQRKSKYGDPLAGPPFRKTKGAPCPQCSVAECLKDGTFRGPDSHPRLCENHRRRWKLYGDPEGVPAEKAPLSSAQLAALAAGRVLGQQWSKPPEQAKARMQASRRKWSRNNPEAVLAGKRAWATGRSAEVRREQQRSSVRNRAARVAVAPHLSPEDMLLAAEYEDILRMDPCSYCGLDGGTVDHIVSLFRGGDDSVDNLTGACRSCNSSKRDKPLLDFMLWRLDSV